MTEWVLQRVVMPRHRPDATAGLVVDGATGWTRSGFDVAAGTTASTGTYFGGFPGAWWRSATGLQEVTCRVRVTGQAVVRVVRSDEEGRAVVVEERVAQDEEVAVAVELPGGAGGWVWLDAEAVEGSATLGDLRYTTDAGPLRRPSATVCVTTFDREADCVRLLEALADDPEVVGHLDRIVVVDQGSRRLRDEPGFPAVAGALGELLEVVVQSNLGGSGGFSRGMFAAVDAGSEFALLLDDDIALETESILRLIALASRAPAPVVVGAQMLSLVDPTVLHSFGERVDRRTWTWTPAVGRLDRVDLAALPLVEPALHRRVEVDFNGWWMCLVPTALIRSIGAALPLFIKWDDTEFALRAAAAGVPTVTLPGAAVWHMPWTAKDDGLDWQAYFQLRNRLVTALVHGGGRGGPVLAASLALDLNHVLCQQYGSAALRRLAIQDVLDGPSHLAATLRERAGHARRLLETAGQTVVDAPAAAERRHPVAPRGAVRSALRLAHVLAHQLTRPRRGRVVPLLARPEGKWWSLGLLDAAAVQSATGRGVFVSRRDRGTAASLVRDAIALRVRLWARWPRLSHAYRRDRDAVASRATWTPLFDDEVSRG